MSGIPEARTCEDVPIANPIILISRKENQMTKVCFKCHIKKPLSAFGKNKAKKDGKMIYCKKCWNAHSAKMRALCPEKGRGYSRNWGRMNYSRRAITTKKWSENNPGRVRELNRRWRKEHPEESKRILTKSMKRERATPAGRLRINMSNAVRASLRDLKQGRHWEVVVGYTVEDLRIHLEALFLPGMTWKNRSKWHIDHKIPQSKFHYRGGDDPEIKKCWALKNLRPLWAFGNLSKGAKII